MIHAYEVMWPGNSFNYLIPYQTYSEDLAHTLGKKATFIKAPEDIRGTVLALLHGIEDDEWVFWCMDDRYPIELDTGKATDVYQFVQGITDPSIVSISYSRIRVALDPWREDRSCRLKSASGLLFYQKTKWTTPWLHHFVRAKWLRNLFASFPDRDFRAKEMDEFYSEEPLNAEESAYCLDHNIVVYGESTHRGLITKNCLESMQRLGFKVPPNFKHTDMEIVMGQMGQRNPNLGEFIYFARKRFRRVRRLALRKVKGW